LTQVGIRAVRPKNEKEKPMTKRFVCIFAVLALLCSPALAEFKGILKSNLQTTISVAPPSDSNDQPSLTVLFVGNLVGPLPGGWELGVYRTVLAPPGAVRRIQLIMPPGVTRIIVQVNLTPGGTAVVNVAQGALQFADLIDKDTQFVYDVTP